MQIGAKDASTVLASFAPTFEAIGVPHAYASNGLPGGGLYQNIIIY